MFNRLALIGVGLIGGSIARAARGLGIVETIVATSRSEPTRQRIHELGLADDVLDTAAAAVKDADLVIVSVPIGAIGAVAKEIGPHLKQGAIVSDVGSVKTAVVRDMAPHIPPGVHFIPGHPVAGTEDSGPDAGFAELFINRWCILTPAKDADPSAVEKLVAILEGVRRQRRADVARAPRPGARRHQPRAAPDRLQHRRHGVRPAPRHRVGNPQIFGERLSRFHPHRRVRPDHVARYFSAQQRGRAGSARPLQRGPRGR